MSGFTPELLAPAGNLASAFAALDAGADAVYAGLGKFNARERGENFTLDEMLGVIEYAHSKSRKVYLTLNTLIKENELDAVAEQVAQLYGALPDAVLVQDIGVARMLREYFPELTLHASTQMGIHNQPGLELAAELGFKRVVLERQLTLPDIARLAEKSPVELEVFIHGALCCSLSGECLFSSWSGGYSGNRGKCKQPCRRRFFSREGNGFFFSTADLCTMEMIPELKRLGIASLKIEGRLKQADYVYNTVRAYRKVLDAEELNKKVLGEARALLADGCGRKWSDGFYSEESMRKLIQFKSLGASGIPCGRISDVGVNGFGFTATRRVHLGDRVRLQPSSGDEGPSMTITKMFVNDAAATVASAGDYCFIPCDKPVEYKALVYKIGQAAALPAVKNLPVPRKKIDIEVRVGAKEFYAVAVNTVPRFEFRCELDLQEAVNRALTAEQLTSELAWRSNPEYASGAISAEIGGDYFWPLSEIKKVRKQLWGEVEAALNAGSISWIDPGAVRLERFRASELSRPRLVPEPAVLETVAVTPHSAVPGNPKARRASSIFSYSKKIDEIILPDFCPPEKIGALKKMIMRAVEDGFCRFRATALYHFKLLSEFDGLEIVTGDPLPVCNSLAAYELQELGACQVQAHVELEKAALEKLIEGSPLRVELYRFGRIPILSTRAQIPAEGKIKDARGNKYMVVKEKGTGLTRLYSAKVLSIPRLPGAADFYDLTNAHWGAKELSEFNFSTELV